MVKNKVVSWILSFVVAFGLWLYVVTVISPESQETFYNIPVTIQGDNTLRSNGLMIVENKNPTVDLRISGNRTELVKLNEKNISIIADVSKIDEAGEHKVKFSYNFPGDVAEASLSVEERNPDYLTVVVENRISKPVDVDVIYEGNLPEGYIYDKENATLDHPQVVVTGPESVLGHIAKAVIRVNLNGRTDSFREELVYTLCDVEGRPVDVELVSTNVQAVNLELQIRYVKEVALKVNVVDGGGATATTSTVEIEPQTIRISGSKAQLESMNEIVLGTVHLGKIPEDTVISYDIVLPEEVANETGIHKATVTVKFPELLTKTLEISTIKAINTDGKKLDLITQVLPVTVRGPKALVEKLEESNVIVTVDFKDVPLGTTTVAAQITFTGEFAQLGAVGDYTVSATLSK